MLPRQGQTAHCLTQDFFQILSFSVKPFRAGKTEKTHIPIIMEVLFMKNMTVRERISAHWEAYGKMLLRADLA